MPFDPDKFLEGSVTPTQAPSPSFNPDQFAAQNPVQDLARVGMDPKLALPESPLSPIERGAFGFVKDPQKQRAYLDKKFGRNNVSVEKMDEGNSNFVVKTEDGKWRQVDPHGLSDIPSDLLKLDFGQAASRFKNFNLKNTVGGAAQFLGEHGFDTAGAAYGGSVGAGALGATLGPAGALAGAALGGAAGGVLGGLTERGVRGSLSALQDATGVEIPGAGNTEDLQKQLMGSMLFGASQELAGPFLKAGLKGSGAVFGRVLKTLGDTPESKQAQAALIKALSGMKDGLARAWVEAPDAVAKYIPDAVKDRIQNASTLVAKQKDSIDSFFNRAQGAMRGLGKQYDAIEQQAKGKTFDALKVGPDGTNPITDILDTLKEKGYLDEKGEVVKKATDEVTADVSGANGMALRKMLDDYSAIQRKLGKASYQDLRVMERNIENYLFGPNQVTDGTLRNNLRQMRTAINNVQSQGLHEINPALATKLSDLNTKYGEAKELLGDLGDKATPQRVDVFLNKVINAKDGTYNKGLMDSVANLLGEDNPTKDILHMEVARQSAPWFTGSGGVRVAGVPIPSSPALARGAMTGVISPYQKLVGGLGDAASGAAQSAGESVAKYLPQVHSFYRGLPDSMKKTVLQNPKYIGIIQDLVSGAAVSEAQDKNKLLEGVGGGGDFQSSQYGK